jgi:hypothetical protein
MNKFRQWYLYHHKEITWFLMGWLCLAALQCVGQGDWIGVLINGGFAVLNYKLNG